MELNNVVLAGRLTKDPDLRYTPSGKAVARFTLAIGRSFKKPDGTKETDFVNCTIWGARAEALCNYNKKGDGIGVIGSIQTGSYDGQDGKRVYTTEVNVQDWSFGVRNGASGNGSAQRGQQPNQSSQNYTRVEQDPFTNNSGPIEVSDDDLPF